ncbi:hypothetical protein ScPMuIL_016539 [Solemya velum]
MTTVIQALETSDSEGNWILQHSGHTMDVHINLYRQMSDLIKCTKVAKLLLIQDFGVVSEYVGKSQRDIQMNDVIPCDQTAASGGNPQDATDENPQNATDEFHIH